MECQTGGRCQGFLCVEWLLLVAVVLTVLLVYEQISYVLKGRHLPGPSIVLPFLGDAFLIGTNPAQFWRNQSERSRKVGMCWNVLFGKFVLYVSDSQLSNKVFENVKPDAFQVVTHPFGEKLFGEQITHMFGEEHRYLRRQLAPNFTPNALGMYIIIQEKMIREHISEWLEQSQSTGGEPMKLRFLVRDLNLAVSQAIFFGPYMSAESLSRINEDYAIFNAGLMSLPVDLPGFAYHRARQAAERLSGMFGERAHQSKHRMSRGEEPTCFVDFWMNQILKEIAAAEATGASPPSSKDLEVGSHLFGMLFASQDASVSSLTWAATLLESHPTVLKRVRKEQQRLRPDPLAPITTKQVREMEYTAMVVKEILRYRPPAMTVPHVTMVDVMLTDTYKVPKGTIVFPSVYDACRQGYTDPDTFDPERFSPQRQEDVLYKANWLVFGNGSHSCVGQRYAVNHLILFVALFSTLVEWTRVRSPGCDDFTYIPTISPIDDGLVRMSARVQAS